MPSYNHCERMILANFIFSCIRQGMKFITIVLALSLAEHTISSLWQSLDKTRSYTCAIGINTSKNFKCPHIHKKEKIKTKHFVLHLLKRLSSFHFSKHNFNEITCILASVMLWRSAEVKLTCKCRTRNKKIFVERIRKILKDKK